MRRTEFFPDEGDIISERPNADARTGRKTAGVSVNKGNENDEERN
jgi:hypothetical protein